MIGKLNLLLRKVSPNWRLTADILEIEILIVLLLMKMILNLIWEQSFNSTKMTQNQLFRTFENNGHERTKQFNTQSLKCIILIRYLCMVVSKCHFLEGTKLNILFLVLNQHWLLFNITVTSLIGPFCLHFPVQFYTLYINQILFENMHV